MQKKNTYIILTIIFVLAGAAALFDYPQIAPKLPQVFKKPFQLGLDLQGGIHLLYEADLSDVEQADKSSAMQGLRDVIERRINLFGVREPVVQVQEKGEHRRLIVELAGTSDPAQAIAMIGQTPFLEFREERTEKETEAILAKIEEVKGKDRAEIEKIENWQLALEDPYFKSTPLTGQYLKKAELGFGQTAYQPQIYLQFNDEGSKVFKELTARNVGKRLAIYIDGIVISAPTVQEAISGGRAQISGEFSIESAKELARNLNAGALPVPINLISQQTVGPTLGKVSLQKSLRAGIIGFLAIVVFMVIFYRLPGLFASLSLLMYVVFLLALFKLIPVTLTLAGIAGFILSMGMAVDANILIFARAAEELKEGKSSLIAFEEGRKRAWPAVRDGNLTTILVGLILFGFGAGFVKGFAFTLVIGNLVGMFAAIFITSALLRCFVSEKLPRWLWFWK